MHVVVRSSVLVAVLACAGCMINFDPMAADAGAPIDAPLAPDAIPCVPTADEATGAGVTGIDAVCDDGVDNDCDGATDHDDLDCPGMRYRSVGVAPGALSPVDTTVQITAAIAQFSSAPSDDVGVGDVVVATVVGGSVLAIIRERISPTAFRVQATGRAAAPTVAAGTPAAVYRAYTSLSAWQQQAENPALPVAAADFDQAQTLVDDDVALTVALYADGEDQGNVIISGWQTSPEHYVRLFTPVGPALVGRSQRHRGVLVQGYRYRAVLDAPAIAIQQSHVRVEGLSVVGFPGAAPTNGALELLADAADLDLRVSHNLVDGNASLGSNGALHLEATGPGAAGLVRVSNNIVWNASGGSSECIWHRDTLGANAEFLIYNNTVWNCARGIEARDTAGRATAINNIAFGSPALYEYNGAGEYGPLSTHNVSGDGSAAVLGGEVQINADPAALFISLTPDAVDLHLRADAPILGLGFDVTTDPRLPIVDDIDGNPRPPGAVDPGAAQR